MIAEHARRLEALAIILRRQQLHCSVEAAEALEQLAAAWRRVRATSEIARSDILRCKGYTAGVIRELATTWHREAHHSAEQYARIAHAYALYEELFPNEVDAPEMMYCHAELLFQADRFCEAAKEYAIAAQSSPSVALKANEAGEIAASLCSNAHK